jgi:dipeptidyl aminopeptidase/acylaminoacyl peptidase
MSDDMHKYIRPEPSSGWINIPWFVSNGYIVFTPDIDYRNYIGNPGQAAYNSVMAAAKYLSKMACVDSMRIGICGHSWGGTQTNYLITHSDVFAAAISAAGTTDFISFYGSLSLQTGSTFQTAHETGQFRLGTDLWQRPDLYINNSPLFRADKVTTPLLMLQNKDDGATPFSQGIEFFTALRRLGKKVWLLQYDNETHGIGDENSAIDFTIRTTQFFDHYLKGLPAPRWMTRGIAATMKGVDDGLDLDCEIKTPGPSLLIIKNQRKDKSKK